MTSITQPDIFKKLVKKEWGGEVVEPEFEYRFYPERKWRFDVAWPQYGVAIEWEGMVWGKGGRHQRPEGFAKDCEKYNEAALLGWVVLRYTQVQQNDVVKIMEDLDRAIQKAM